MATISMVVKIEARIIFIGWDLLPASHAQG
jgi:hypothetical protein